MHHNYRARSAVGSVSDCISRGRELDHGLVPYFRWDWSWKYVHETQVNRLVKLSQEKVWLGELTISTWP